MALSGNTMTTDNRIDLFAEHFQSEMEMISSAQFRHGRTGFDRSAVYKRLLFCCLIGTVSDVIPPPSGPGAPGNRGEKNKWKFLAAIRLFGDWPDHKRISRPYLEKLLSFTSKPLFEPVKKHIKTLPPWPQNSIVTSAYDLEPNWFEANWPKKAEGQPEKIDNKKGESWSFQDLRHDHLFYGFRHKLVHELRALNPEEAISQDLGTPYYHKGRDLTEHPVRHYWQLKHPPGFVYNLAKRILRGIVADFRSRQVDPGLALWSEPYWSDF